MDSDLAKRDLAERDDKPCELPRGSFRVPLADGDAVDHLRERRAKYWVRPTLSDPFDAADGGPAIASPRTNRLLHDVTPVLVVIAGVLRHCRRALRRSATPVRRSEQGVGAQQAWMNPLSIGCERRVAG